MKEQPLFAPGDLGVCVDSKSVRTNGNAYKLIEGKTYKMCGIYRCSCGLIYVNVGIPLKQLSGSCFCEASIPSKGFSWHRQTRFVPVDFDRYAEETFHQSLKGKPVNA